MVNVGDQAIEFSGKDVLTETDWSMSDHQGKLILIAFNGFPWCPPCKAEVPVLQEIWNVAKLCSSNLEFVIVNDKLGEQTDGLKAFLNDENISITVIEDHSIRISYEVGAVPTLVFLDKDHKVCAKKQGYEGEGDTKSYINNILENCGLECNAQSDYYGQFRAVAQILFGVTSDGGGITISGGKFIPVPPWDPLRTMDVDKRDALTALAISQLANLLTDIGARRDLEIRSLKAADTAMKNLMKKAELKPASREKNWMALPRNSHEHHEKS